MKSLARFLVLALLLALPLAAGCSEDVPPAAFGAWSVMFTAPGGCKVKPHNRSLGILTDAKVDMKFRDGDNGAEILCTVTGAGPFSVQGRASQGPLDLEVVIDSLPDAATAKAGNPALGSVSYLSPETVKMFRSPADKPCKFYFSKAPPQLVQPGYVWLEFKCDTVENREQSEPNICAITKGWLYFELCEA
ncbi:MAG: hypothetical protein HY744_13765 [Deltaproteobacteria bacterium]|nr:hypothetical protein [Deltaproteobacteria bacterium]